MHRVLGLLLLAAEGALAQSWEPSEWDANVPAYGGTVADCPCDPKTHVCNQTITATIVQTETSTLQVTWASKPALKFAYLTDQDGTIISYKDGGWDTVAGGSRIMTFSWDSSQQLTGLVPHLVYADSCADVVPRVKVWKDINEPDGDYTLRSVITSTWRAKLALMTEKYDVGNSPSEDTSEDAKKTEECDVGTPCVPPGTPTILASDIDLANDWFNNGGEAKAAFPTDGVGGADTNAAWLTTQDGTIIDYEERIGSLAYQGTDKPFPRGTVELHACRLFKKKKLCATASVVDKYIEKIDSLTETSVGDYAKANTAFTDVFTGDFDPAAGRTSIRPKDSNCKQYVIYAKESDDQPGTIKLLYAFAFDKALHFAANSTIKYKVTLTCDGAARTTGEMDLAFFNADNPSTFNSDFEKQVDFPRCLADHDGHDHAEGAEEEPAGHPSDNTTWFQHEGRDCMCDKGTLMCKRASAGSPFSMNEGETVGLVIAVSAIVFICIGAIFFFGYSAMLKRKQGDKGVVLQSDGDRL